MIPEYLKNKKIKSQFEGINVPSALWEHVPKKKKYYYAAISIKDIKQSDLVCVDLHGALVKRIAVGNGTVTLYANKRLENFDIDIYIIDDNMKVGVSTEDKHILPDPKKG